MIALVQHQSVRRMEEVAGTESVDRLVSSTESVSGTARTSDVLPPSQPESLLSIMLRAQMHDDEGQALVHDELQREGLEVQSAAEVAALPTRVSVELVRHPEPGDADLSCCSREQTREGRGGDARCEVEGEDEGKEEEARDECESENSLDGEAVVEGEAESDSSQSGLAQLGLRGAGEDGMTARDTLLERLRREEEQQHALRRDDGLEPMPPSSAVGALADTSLAALTATPPLPIARAGGHMPAPAWLRHSRALVLSTSTSGVSPLLSPSGAVGFSAASSASGLSASSLSGGADVGSDGADAANCGVLGAVPPAKVLLPPWVAGMSGARDGHNVSADACSAAPGSAALFSGVSPATMVAPLDSGTRMARGAADGSVVGSLGRAGGASPWLSVSLPGGDGFLAPDGTTVPVRFARWGGRCAIRRSASDS